MQMPPPGSVKASVITAPAEELEAKIREWQGQHGRARIMAGTQSSASHNGALMVTLTLFYTE
jgi:hypothetical protein